MATIFVLVIKYFLTKLILSYKNKVLRKMVALSVFAIKVWRDLRYNISTWIVGNSTLTFTVNSPKNEIDLILGDFKLQEKHTTL